MNKQRFPQADLPTIHIVGDNISEAWHKAFLAVYDQGFRIMTPKHEEGVTPLGYDASVLVKVLNPLGEPRFHVIASQGLLDELENYRLEVVNGVHNH